MGVVTRRFVQGRGSLATCKERKRMTEIILAPSTSGMDSSSRHLPRVPPNSAVQRLEQEAILLQQETMNTPKICSVNPGRTLELSTIIGLSKYSNNMRSVTTEHAVQHSMSVEENQFSGGSMFAQHRGQLKSGRLRPLSLHFAPQLTSDACLGILPVKSQRVSSQHHRSLTAPTLRQAQTRNNSHHKQNVTRRSYSAAIGNSFGLILTGAILVQKQQPAAIAMANKSSLPSVVTPSSNQEQPTTINDTNNETTATTSNLMTIKIQEKKDENSDLLIHPLHTENKEETTLLNTTNLPTEIPHTIEKEATEELLDNETNGTIHTAKVQEEFDSINTNRHSKRKSSGGGRRIIKSGKLSFGWSHPSQQRAISPIVGILPPITDSKRIR